MCTRVVYRIGTGAADCMRVIQQRALRLGAVAAAGLIGANCARHKRAQVGVSSIPIIA